MKILRLFMLLFSINIFFSCSALEEALNQNFREVRYFATSIRDIERNKITFANGTVWKTDRLFIGVNMSEVFVMLDEVRNRGYMYYRETRIGLTQLTGDFFQYEEGSTNFIKSFQNEGAVLELADGSLWIVPVSQREMINSWLLNTEIIINKNNKLIINPEKLEFISTVRLDTTIEN